MWGAAARFLGVGYLLVRRPDAILGIHNAMYDLLTDSAISDSILDEDLDVNISQGVLNTVLRKEHG